MQEDKTDKRLIYDKDRRLLVCVNYKAGFSTFNNAIGERSDLNLPSLRTLHAAKKIEGLKKVLFVRDPLARFISFLNDKIVMGRGRYEWMRSKLVSLGAQDSIEAIEQADGNLNIIVREIEALLPYLSVIALLNEKHLHPQHAIFTKMGLTHDTFDDIFDFKQNILFIEEHYGIAPKIMNVTKSENIKNALATDKVTNFCNSFYAYDKLLHARAKTRGQVK